MDTDLLAVVDPLELIFNYLFAHFQRYIDYNVMNNEHLIII